jgi:uncharacterized protein (TIGR01568 family)
MAKKGFAAILYKLRDVHHRSPPSPPSPSTPSAHRHSQRCYPPSAWPWPSCRAPRTSSFRARSDENAAAAVFRTVNSVYDTPSEHFARPWSSMDDDASRGIDPRSPALLAVAGEAAAGAEQTGEEEDKETAVVVRGVLSERLFFEPAGAEFLPTKQVTHCACVPLSDSDEKAAPVESVPIRERCQQQAPARGENNEVSVNDDDESATPSDVKENQAAKEAQAAAMKGGAVVVTVESKDPYGDFGASMAEMVAAHGLRDWDALEELLALYLKLNAKDVHAAIVGAFIDLLVSMQASPPSLPSPTPSSLCITFEEYSSATFEYEEKS